MAAITTAAAGRAAPPTASRSTGEDAGTIADRSSHLVEARREEVAGREDAAVGAQPILLHHVFVVDLSIGFERPLFFPIGRSWLRQQQLGLCACCVRAAAAAAATATHTVSRMSMLAP